MDDITIKALEKTKQSSDRGRWVLLVMQVACIVVFIAAWHELPSGWAYARLRTARAAVWYLDCGVEKHPELPASSQQIADLEKNRHDECHILGEEDLPSLAFRSRELDCETTEQQPFCDDEISQAKVFLVRTAFSPIQARKRLENLESSFVERTMNVAVPFLGITLDVNDLGLLSGITFVLLLTWLLYSLRREGENLEMLFASESDESLPAIYHLLSMSQVFTIPPRTKAKRSRLAEAPWRILVKILFVTPALVESFVVWNDFMTLSVGRTLHPKGGISEFYWEIGLFVFVLVLTFLCVQGSIAVGTQWKDAYDRIQLRFNREKFC